MESLPPTEETDFRPPTQVTTPETNPVYEVAISERAKERVRRADPNQGLCLITKARMPVQFCHCIRKSAMRDLKTVHVYALVFIRGFIYIS